MLRSLILLILFSFTLTSWGRPEEKEILSAHYGPHERQVFDLWLPKSRFKTPLVIYIHGGGWVMGSKDEFRGHRIIRKYLKSGIAVAAINYRYLKHAPLQNIMREDIAGFVQYMRYHAKEYNIDKKLIMSHGFSAGGSASLWLATHDDIADPESVDPVKHESSRILAAGHLSAQVSYDFVDWYDYFGKEKVDTYLGGQVWSRYHLNSIEDLFTQKGMEIREDLDMYGNMTSDDAPVLFWNGHPDIESTNGDHFLHGPRHAKLLFEKAQKVGLDTKIILDGGRVIKSDVMGETYKFFLEKLQEAKPFSLKYRFIED